MDWNLIMACAHHLAVFGFVGIFAAEFALLRPGLSGPRLQQLARLDAAFGAFALLVIVIGITRVWISGWDYYAGNHLFWAKMGAFALGGILSVPPTVAIRRWLKAGQGVSDYAPPAKDVAIQRRFIHLEALMLVVIPLLAAAMARGYGV